MTTDALTTFRFGEFELDVAAYTLRRRGRRVRIERRPMDLLIFLVQRRGQLVSRDEIVEWFWGPDALIDIDIALNSAVKKVRHALHDRVERPAFIETVQGKGYRFVASVTAVQPIGETRTATPPPPLIAVLPFLSLGGGPDREYIADGFTEDVSAALGQINPDHLAVIGRTSAMMYKRTTKSLAEIGRELNASYLVEGSIRAEAERWRVSAALINVPDQRQIWAASFDSEPNSILHLQRDLSRSIAEQIRLKLSPDTVATLGRRHSRNAEAHDLYLQGRHAWNQLTAATNRRALECYARATALDPGYALAWSGMADLYSASAINSDARPADVWPRAREAAANAMSAEPDLAESQTSFGLVEYWFNWNWQGAELAHRRAIALDASYAFAHLQLGIVLAYLGRYDDARLAVRRARELDPLWAMTHALSAHVEFIAGGYSTSLRFAQQATVIRPGFWIGCFHLAQAHERLGNSDAALAALTEAERSGSNSKILSLRGYLLAKAGRLDEARTILRTLETIAQERYLPPYSMALVQAGLGERDSAFTWLERAYEARDVHLVFLVVDPKWEAFRHEPRFQQLVERCGFGSP